MKRLLPLLGVIFLHTTGFAQEVITDTVTTVDTAVVDAYDGEMEDEEETHEFDSLSTYSIPQYQAYAIADSVLTNLKSDKAFWYANETPRRQKTKQPDPNLKYEQPFYLENWFRTLVWIIIITAFVGVLIWFLIASDVQLFRRKPKLVESDTEIDISEDIFAVNYEQELAKAIANDNLRLGIRLMYLHVLRLFAERDIIEYKMERTNSEYLSQLYSTAYYKDFFRLTRSFEYVWYGKFDISTPAFEMIRTNYTNLKSRL